MMRCLGCEYDLANLPQHRCPECGQPFDPTDLRTFDSGMPRSMLRWRRVAAISSFYPWLGMLIIFGTALHAWHLLGHWPRIYVDDPKFVAGLSPMYVLAMTCLFGFPFGLFINAGSTFMVFIHAEFRGWRQYAVPLAIAFVGWTLWVIFIKTDPGDIYTWLGD